MQENISPEETNGPERPDSGCKKHISPREPKDLLTWPSYFARGLVPTYLKLGVLNRRDAVALFISSGVFEFGRDGKPYVESGETIAKALGMPPKAFRDTVSGLKKAGIIGRTGKNGDRLRDRRWFIPAIEPSLHLKKTAGENGGDRRCERRVTAGVDGGATAGVDGGHLRESGSERIRDEANKEEEEPKTPPPFPRSSSKKMTAEESREFLKPYDPRVAEGFSRGYYALIAKVSGCRLHAAKELDVSSAELCLRDLPPEYRRPEILWGWAHDYARRLPRRWSKETHYFTKFEDSWTEYRPTADRILEEIRKAERAQQAAEHAEREAERRARHEAFVAGLPADEDVAAALLAVPKPATFGYNDSVRWVDELAAATGLMLKIENSTYDYGYIKSAYRKVGYDPGEMIRQTLRFFAGIAVGVLKRLREDEERDEIKPLKVRWESFCRHFGLEERDARLCRHRIPEEALNYRGSPRDGPCQGTDGEDGGIPEP